MCLNLINGKLRSENIFNQVINNILNHDRYKDISIILLKFNG